METTEDKVFVSKSLPPQEGFEIRHELYETLKILDNAIVNN